MFGIGFPELIVILVLIVLVVGPEQLPGVVRKGVALLQETRRHLSEIRQAVDKQTQTLTEPLQNIQKDIRSGAEPSAYSEPTEGQKRFSEGEPP